MSKQAIAWAGIILLATVVSCQTNTVDPVVQADSTNDATIQAYVKAKNITAKRTNSGLYYVITTPNPSGKTPQTGEEVQFQYVLSTLTGTRIDSTAKDSSAYFPYGVQQILYGLEEGISYMHEGETAILLLPSSIAYGNRPPTGIETYAPVRFDVKFLRSRTEDQQITDYIATKKLTVSQKTSSGLRLIKTTSVASGDSLITGKVVTVAYSGRLIRGTKAFDSGTFDFTLGGGSVVPGFEEGVRKLKLGEKATIIFPSTIGYGTKGNSAIPPYAPLIFDIEIKAVK